MPQGSRMFLRGTESFTYRIDGRAKTARAIAQQVEQILFMILLKAFPDLPPNCIVFPQCFIAFRMKISFHLCKSLKIFQSRKKVTNENNWALQIISIHTIPKILETYLKSCSFDEGMFWSPVSLTSEMWPCGWLIVQTSTAAWFSTSTVVWIVTAFQINVS